MGLRPTKGDESRSVVRPVADAPGSVTEPEHGTPSVSEGLGAALLSTERFQTLLRQQNHQLKLGIREVSGYIRGQVARALDGFPGQARLVQAEVLVI